MSYMVFVEGGNAPRVQHETIEEARTEAERLSMGTDCTKRNVFLLEIVDVLTPIRRPSHAWRSELMP